MASGQPDFGLYAPTKTIVGLSDMGELAARLGSIVTFDRRGNVVRLDDFEGGIEQWDLGGVGTGRKLEWSEIYHRSGNFCAKLTSHPTAGMVAEMATSVSYPILSKIGFEFSAVIDTNLRYLTILTQLYNGTSITESLIRWTQATALWKVTDDTQAWRDLSPTMKLSPVAPVFNTIKLVADFVNNQYVRLIVNNIDYDLSAYGLYSAGSAEAPRIDIKIQMASNFAASTYLYVDDFIQTQNEP